MACSFGSAYSEPHISPDGRTNESRSANSGQVSPAGLIRAGLAAILSIGVFLRLWQYLDRASLFVDEIAIARNLLARSPATLLTEPLAFNQIAPKAFLLVEKFIAWGFGAGELQLRLLPFLAGLLSLPLFTRLALKLELRAGALFSVALFALAVPLLRLGAQVKPYAIDVFATLALLLLSLRWRERHGRSEAAVLAGLGLISVWFSFASVLVLFGLGVTLAYCAFRDSDPQERRFIAIVLVTWLVAGSAGVVAARSSETPGMHGFLTSTWASAFMPPPWHLPEMLHWFSSTYKDLMGRTLGYPWRAMYLVLMGVGAIVLWRRRSDAVAILLAPVAGALVAAAAHRYPFRDRLVVFILPSLFLLMGEAVDYTWHRLSSFPRSLRLGIGLALLGGPIYALVQHPPVYRPDDMRTVLSHVRAASGAGTVAYIYYGAGPGTTYYGAEFGLQALRLVQGKCHHEEPRLYLRELDQLRGQSQAWIIFARAAAGERELILSYLDRIGTRLDSVGVVTKGGPEVTWASAYLYDLTDPSRLAMASAATFPLPILPRIPDVWQPCPSGG